MLAPFLNAGLIEAGCDEAGRGCLAGPVFGAAVILPTHFGCPTLNDSKLLSEAKRRALRLIIEKEAVAWAVAKVEPAEIDKINILNASFLAMHRAIKQLRVTPDCLLIDGNRFNPYKKIPHHCIVKGDGKFLSIAAASVLAKTHRDAYMIGLHPRFPVYQWCQNKGYPTAAHRRAIQLHGPCWHHRNSFKLFSDGQ